MVLLLSSKKCHELMNKVCEINKILIKYWKIMQLYKLKYPLSFLSTVI